MYDTWHLLLYSDKTLAYFHPSKNKLRGVIILTPDSKCLLKNEKNFVIVLKNREYELEACDLAAEIWVSKITESIKSL